MRRPAGSSRSLTARSASIGQNPIALAAALGVLTERVRLHGGRPIGRQLANPPSSSRSNTVSVLTPGAHLPEHRRGTHARKSWQYYGDFPGALRGDMSARTSSSHHLPPLLERRGVQSRLPAGTTRSRTAGWATPFVSDERASPEIFLEWQLVECRSAGRQARRLPLAAASTRPERLAPRIAPIVDTGYRSGPARHR